MRKGKRGVITVSEGREGGTSAEITILLYTPPRPTPPRPLRPLPPRPPCPLPPRPTSPFLVLSRLVSFHFVSSRHAPLHHVPPSPRPAPCPHVFSVVSTSLLRMYTTILPFFFFRPTITTVGSQEPRDESQEPDLSLCRSAPALNAPLPHLTTDD